MTANVLKRKISLRIKRKRRIRSKISGTSLSPRISLFKSNRTIYVQAICDDTQTTLVSLSGKKLSIKANKDGANILGKEFAALLKSKNLNSGVFDRNGYLYHGVVAAFADALRENGIKL